MLIVKQVLFRLWKVLLNKVMAHLAVCVVQDLIAPQVIVVALYAWLVSSLPSMEPLCVPIVIPVSILLLGYRLAVTASLVPRHLATVCHNASPAKQESIAEAERRFVRCAQQGSIRMPKEWQMNACFVKVENIQIRRGQLAAISVHRALMLQQGQPSVRRV